MKSLYFDLCLGLFWVLKVAFFRRYLTKIFLEKGNRSTKPKKSVKNPGSNNNIPHISKAKLLKISIAGSSVLKIDSFA